MYIRFNNEKQIRFEDILITTEFIENASRETITLTLNKDVIDISELNDILSEEDNLSQILIVTNDLIERYYNDFFIKVKCGTERKLVNVETQEYKEVIVFKIAKLTYIEKKLKELGVM